MKNNLKNIAALGLFGFVALNGLSVNAEVAEKAAAPAPKEIHSSSITDKNISVAKESVKSMEKDSEIKKAEASEKEAE